MDFYYIADKRKPNEIEHGNKRNKFYSSKGAVKAQLTAMKQALAMSVNLSPSEKWAQHRQDKLDNLTIMVVSGEPRELEE